MAEDARKKAAEELAEMEKKSQRIQDELKKRA